MMQPGRPELLAASDEAIDDAVRYADPLALRGVLYQLTGDDELLDIELNTMVVGGFREMRLVANKADVARIRRQGGGVSQVLPGCRRRPCCDRAARAVAAEHGPGGRR